MPRNGNSESQNSPESRLAPEPEGPEEIHRRFERLNRRGGGKGLRDLVGGLGKKALYGTFAVVEVAAIVLGVFFGVPFMDIVALGLPGLLLIFMDQSRDKSKTGEQSEPGGEPETELAQDPARGSGYGSREAPAAEPEGAQQEENVLETLLKRFGVEIPEDESRSGGR